MIVMEACSTAHHWARRFQSLGIEVRLINPQYVTPFVKTNKNDRNDAEAIVEAASRPAMRFVTVKSVEQQDIQAAHRMRAILLRHCTAMINQMRRLLGERGLTISRSPEAFKRAIPELLSNSADELTSFCQTLLTELLQHLHALEERIHLIETSIQSFMKKSTLCKKIAEVPGIGPITATAVVAAVGDARQFRNGRHLAAWLGLVPRQYSSGGKSRLHGISRRGDTYCGPCSSMARGLFCAMRRQKLIHRASGFSSGLRDAGITARQSHWPTRTRGPSRYCSAAMRHI
jgi:transposase